jgi:hypothetical protein
MTTTTEAVPTAWTALDEGFFRVAADVFTPEFLWGAGAMLASYDLDLETAAAPSPVVAHSEPARREPTASRPLAA